MGEVFGRYVLQRRIGAGGMAEVFQAQAFGPEGFVKDVVIKRILPAFGEDPDFVAMFINEARLAARLHHANIVQIFDFDQVDGVYYIAMEWVHGTDLRRVMSAADRRRMPVPSRVAVQVGVEVLKGLHYASTFSERGQPLNVIHRDISPHNLLVSFAGEIKITDFGIAKVAALASSTRTGILKGKLAYMSPEQATNQRLDARSDIFSLGIVLWELLTGRRLYRGDTEAELLVRVRQAEIAPPREINPEIPEDLERVVMRMLALAPSERPPNAAAALDEFGRFAQVGDALHVGSYLRALMPEEATRDRRGETERVTEADPLRAAVIGASANAVTHTREGAGRASVTGQPSASGTAATTLERAPKSDIAPLSKQASGDSPNMKSPPRRRGAGNRWLFGIAALSFSCCGIAGWWLAGALDKDPSLEPFATAALEIKSEPSGAIIQANGLTMGKAPLTLEGQSGQVLQLRAGLGDLVVQRTHELRGRQTVVFQLGGPRAKRPPRAAKAEQADRAKVTTQVDLAPSAERSRPARDAPRMVDPRAEQSGSAHARSSAPPSIQTLRQVTRSRDPAARPAREPRERGIQWGLLDVVVSPWAEVKVDGRPVGHTPLRGLRLAAGRHRVELSNPELARKRVMQIELRAGERVPVREQWD